jgi:methionyl aminopeptidase
MFWQTDDIQVKTPAQVEKMRAAGLVVARTLQLLAEAVRPGVSTGELDEMAADAIADAGATSSFKGYHGYPATICASVNDQVVHGIPSHSQVLADGDIISIDCGAIVDGWHGDSAVTVGVGEVEPRYLRMAKVCEDAMWAGIAAARPGGRLGDISAAIERSVRSAVRSSDDADTDLFGAPGSGRDGAQRSYGIVKHYGGHGIGTEMHQEPHVLNYGRPGRGPRLQVGMALAIEPMITMGAPDTVELDDGWTVVTRDGSRAAHTEHSFALTADGPWVLTAFDGGRSRLGDAASSRATVRG